MNEPGRTSSWPTSITRIEPDRVEIRGRRIAEIIGSLGLLEAAYFLFHGGDPDPATREDLSRIARKAWADDEPHIPFPAGTPMPKALAASLLLDESLASYPADGWQGGFKKTIFCLGRTLRHLGLILGDGQACMHAGPDGPFRHWIYRAFTGETQVREDEARMLEALAVACLDHGVTPPSTQIAILGASARTSYEVAIAQGIAGITHVHGGAAARAAEFFLDAVTRAGRLRIPLEGVLRILAREHLGAGARIPGLGHRVHERDPRCLALIELAKRDGIAGEAVESACLLPDVFSGCKGHRLPLNVDGAIGAIIADMGFSPVLATAVFVLGRVPGLSAHYYEEVTRFRPMRWIKFHHARYDGE